MTQSWWVGFARFASASSSLWSPAARWLLLDLQQGQGLLIPAPSSHRGSPASLHPPGRFQQGVSAGIGVSLEGALQEAPVYLRPRTLLELSCQETCGWCDAPSVGTGEPLPHSPWSPRDEKLVPW